jgi:protease-4
VDTHLSVHGPVDTRLRVEGPVSTRVTADLPPVADVGGVKAVPVRAGNPATRVAIVDVDGLLLNTPFVGPMSVGENPVALFREKLDAAEADPAVRAVVLRVNSPGGGVAACAVMRRDLERFKSRSGKPVVACLLDTAAGGAYHLASAADKVVAGPATVTGGVGIVLNLFNLRDLMAQFNILPQSIKAGIRVDIGTSAKALSDEDKAILQGMADAMHKQMQADIRKSRPGVAEDPVVFDGRVFLGPKAVELGLADHLGDLDDAIDLAAGTLGRPETILYRRPNDPAYTVHAVTANVPLQGSGLLPSVPGLDRSKLPTFLSAWQPEMTMEKLGGK